MVKVKTKYFFLFTFISSLIFVNQCFASDHPLKNIPCWLTDLSSTPGHSVYGVARSFSASAKAPEHFAKLNAINNWQLANGLSKITTKQVLTDLDEYYTGKDMLYFNDVFTDKGNIYALVSDQKLTVKPARNCNVDECNLESCEPNWLCSGQSNDITLLGISAPAVHPNDPLKHMIDNAQQLARTVNLAHVKGETFLLNIDSTYVKTSNLQQTFKIDELDHQVNPVKVGKMCHYKSTLISEISFTYGKVYRGHDWLNTPNIGGVTGAIGHAKGITSTGRMSDLLNLAARRGLFALAKAKNINVENDVEMSISNSGFYSLIRKTHQTTESLISAYVADMKMELNEKVQPEIYIWLLENKGTL
ncbi:hypothetical protein KO525_11745 [Psychrosphaera sp. B3R10]|uniref:hypothetical protein n=1 Tax=unclassified Psychrosphaera TaxID=2641570 RepID=UPI001C09CC42|nr:MULTISPECIES: hypothetical protein [unclassified Psychrosphaera]MBU2881128.1 hypothetical protein [Psychrosphaera sp. I2R16]MBU2990052.1 hypothetical protein [Psychrosphaera sp. B3R10]MDO6721165.1 hypothetical protein [Psychrosphaera sp. 1_MG-2023]